MGIRKRAVDAGQRVYPACGYTWTPKPTKASPKPRTRTCARNAGAGTTHQGQEWCDFHEWWAHNELKGAGVKTQVLAASSIAMQRARFFGDFKNIGPHQAILEEIQRTAGIIAWLEDMFAQMRDSGTPEADIMIQYTKLGITTHAWMQLYQQERHHLVQASANAIKCGVAEREVKLKEDMGRILAATMMALIHDRELGLTPGQIQKAPQIVRRLLGASPRMDFNANDVVDAALTPAEVTS